MNSVGAPRLRGRGTVKLEEMHYGKLVVSRGGHVAPGGGFCTTYRTNGLRHPDRLLPARLLDGASLQADRTDEPFRADGILLFRLIEDGFVAMRARHLSESGDGNAGRTFLQATMMQIAAPRGWSSVPPAFPRWFGDIACHPDLVGTPPSQRLDVAPVEHDFEPPETVTEASLDAWGSRREDRLARIVHAFESPDSVVVLGDDAFDDPSMRVTAFLDDLALALAVMDEAGRQIAPRFQIICGLSPHSVRYGLVLTSSVSSTPVPSGARARFRQLVKPLNRRYPRQGGSAARPAPETASTGIQYGRHLRTQDAAAARTEPARPRARPEAPLTVEQAHLALTSQFGRRPPDAAPSIGPASPADRATRSAMPARTISPATAEALCDRTLSDFTIRVDRVRTGNPASDEDIADLFAFASDPDTHRMLRHWDPFWASQIPPAHLLLALLLGLQGRERLLDRFTLCEVLLVKAQWTKVSGHPGAQQQSWLPLFLKTADVFIGRLGFLNKTERDIVRNDPDLAAYAANLSENANLTVFHRHKFDELLNRKNQPELSAAPGDALILDVVEKSLCMRLARGDAERSSALSYCTLSDKLEVKSITDLPQRGKLRSASNEKIREDLDWLNRYRMKSSGR